MLKALRRSVSEQPPQFFIELGPNMMRSAHKREPIRISPRVNSSTFLMERMMCGQSRMFETTANTSAGDAETVLASSICTCPFPLSRPQPSVLHALG